MLGTSFFGDTISTTVNKLESLLGPSLGPSGDGKTLYNWNFKINDVIFTVYDWKEYKEFDKDELIEWHIGAYNEEDSVKVKNRLDLLLNDKIFNQAVNELSKYVTSNKLQSLIIGVSGGIDSTVCAAICHEVSKHTNIPLIGRSLPTFYNKYSEQYAAKLAGDAFCNDFKGITITGLFDHIVSSIRNLEGDIQTPLANGNIQARLRMIYLYNLASIHKGMVIDTDNLTEHYLGYWTLHGDVGDYKPIGNLWKTEVFELARWLFEYYKFKYEITNDLNYLNKANAIQASLKLKPTAGLGITDSDLEELGAETYTQVDNILKEITAWKRLAKRRGDFPEGNLKEQREQFLSEQHMLTTPIEIILNVTDKHFNSEFKRK